MSLDNAWDKPTTVIPPRGGALHKDDGKVPITMTPKSLVEAVAKVLHFGSKKYKPNNWRAGSSWTRFANSVFRHLYQWLEGETYDPESGLNHLYHAATNIAFLIEWEKTFPEGDDRWIPPSTPTEPSSAPTDSSGSAS